MMAALLPVEPLSMMIPISFVDADIPELSSIMLSAIPSIYQDFTYGHQGEWTHYGMMMVGFLYFIESLLWTMDLWKN